MDVLVGGEAKGLRLNILRTVSYNLVPLFLVQARHLLATPLEGDRES